MNGATGDWKWGRRNVQGMPLTRCFFLHNIFSSASPCSQSSSMGSSKSSTILYKPLKIFLIAFLLGSEFFENRLSSSFTKF